MLQFNALMGSINRHAVQERIAQIYDMAHAAQATGKDVKEYTNKLRRAVGLGKAGGTAKDFLKDIGSV